ncbi:MAG TPA: dTDP-glucose 4,6-dehydratase [Methanothrix soehngenii]|jgi:dTDP-glucose 4,6-dehydratase|uniref:dTDP-glucose 4,6-dehydratase n=5 Tax=root TaxID=1 RepID=F4BZE1_METSG|nr:MULTISPECIES: dTDP-glucose 4,6-dehydratase [Methanothrix]NYT09916.1 dTDP-glucose 4,6-dehydratase [Methanosarcinales archaeon]AEB69011.1 dTDP-glucose 4,6-dehydratase [Methanothrix soehngenii GP6]MBP7068354.1 dTDP-glucose 4,6-dehydratase [Methanothrix sp.]MDD3551545.1 dTDP-glucose 4,6-dehydratase [Methanothrix soehngenii]MDY0412005.1 dTDP-glucose 4,6-dehydratase [Methanothrix soehngenii]
MNLLVTGGLGFIGSNFIRLMLNRHDDCRILNLDAQGFGSNIQNLADYKDDRRYTFFRGDIADSSLVSSLVEKADLVVNFAAETHVDRSISRPDSFLHSNVNGVFCLLEAIRDHNPSVRYVQISTDEVYGDILRGSSTEDSTLRPSSPYSASKAAGDVFVLAYARTYGLEAMITRCTNNYGPYQFPEKLIPKTIIRAKEGLKIPIYGTGENVRDWIYVTDHCRAVEQVLNRGRRGEIYNISAGEERTNLFIAKFILEMLGKSEDQIEFVEDRPGHDARYSLDSSRIRKELGWRPERSFEEGLQTTVEWYLQNPDWYGPLVNDSVLSATPWRLKW